MRTPGFLEGVAVALAASVATSILFGALAPLFGGDAVLRALIALLGLAYSLAVAPADSESLGRDLSTILDLVAQMDAAETDGVDPMAHPLEMAQRLREDVVSEEDRRDSYQSNAPAVENGLFLVPKVIE